MASSPTCARGQAGNTASEHVQLSEAAPALSATVEAPLTILRQPVEVLRSKLRHVQREANLFLVYFTNFCDFVGLTILAPGLRFMLDPSHPGAFYDVRTPAQCRLGVNATGNATAVPGCDDRTSIPVGQAVAYMMFAFGLAQLISGPILGSLSDRFGPRRVLIFSTAGTTAAFVIQGLLWSFWPHLAARFVGGLFAGSRPVCQSYIAKAVPRHERAGACADYKTRAPRVSRAAPSAISYSILRPTSYMGFEPARLSSLEPYFMREGCSLMRSAPSMWDVGCRKCRCR